MKHIQDQRGIHPDKSEAEWRDKNGHLLGRIAERNGKLIFSVKCHRCKEFEEKEIQLVT